MGIAAVLVRQEGTIMSAQPAGVRINTIGPNMADNWRLAMYALGNQFLSHHRAMTDLSEMAPTTLLVYLTVSLANVQKAIRQPGALDGYTGTKVLPRSMIVPISRSAVSAATGLPRETVRRQIAQLVQSGMLVEEQGGVSLPMGAIADQGMEPLLEPLLKDFARTAEQLLRMGVIEIKT
jgi:hypothetical protein